MRLLPTKRVWKRLALGLAILIALALIANGFMVWRTESRLQAKIAEIRAAGDPATLADLAPVPIPPDQNAAAILAEARGSLDNFSRDHASFNAGPIGISYADVETQGVPPTRDQIETVRKVLDKYPEIDESIAAAAHCDSYASLADFDVDPHSFVEAAIENVQNIRSVGRFVPWRMRVLVADGSPDEAVMRGIELLNISRHLEKEPLLVNYLVAIAMRGIAVDALHRVLSENRVSAETHEELDGVLQHLDDPQRLARTLNTERAYANSIAAESGLPPLAGEVSPIWLRLAGWPMKRLYVNALGVYGELYELAGQQYFEVREQIEFDNAMPTSKYGIMGALIAPALRSAYNANARDIATIRSLRIANALAQYRDEHGREADGLEDMSLPEEATIDPFSGQSLKLKHTPDGWVIYSLMRNGVDDEGDFTDLKDYGLAPRKHVTQ